MKYEYKTIPYGASISEKEFNKKGGAAKVFAQMDAIINVEAAEGWEYYEQIMLPISISPGCLGSLFGAGTVTKNMPALVFRRPVSDLV